MLTFQSRFSQNSNKKKSEVQSNVRIKCASLLTGSEAKTPLKSYEHRTCLLSSVDQTLAEI